MSDFFAHPVLPLFAGLFFGAVLAWLVLRSSSREPVLRSRLASSLDDLAQAEEENTELEAELRDLTREMARLEEANRHLLERVEQGQDEIAGVLAHNRGEFANLARQILDEQSKRFSQSSHEQLGQLLIPFRDRIVEFRERVEKTHDSESERFAALRQELSHLRELNQQISQDALDLTRALRGESQVQGAWGEMILERILEQSGLQKGSEYFTQESHHTEINGETRRVRPDVIIHLPDKRHVIVDSKVSLHAYTEHVNAGDPAEAEEAAKRHRDSVRAHLKGLSFKNYQETYQLQSLDFVLLLIPIEGAFSLALQRETDLHDLAFRQNIIIVTPSTLLASLRVIENLWRQEKQNHNALAIAEEAGKLYDKFVGFTGDLETIEAHLAQAQSAYRSAHNKLTTGRGNLVGRAEKLRELGARARKTLPASFQPEDLERS